MQLAGHRLLTRGTLSSTLAAVVVLAVACANDGPRGQATEPTGTAHRSTTTVASERSAPTSATAPTSSAPPSTAPPSTEGAPTPPPEVAAATETSVTHPSTPPTLADTPEGLAAQLVQAERTVRDDAASAQALTDAAHLLQYAYRHLAHRPEWDATIGARLPADLHRSWLANVAARREFLGMYTRQREQLPAWRIVAPPPAEVLLQHYRAAEAAHGVPWQYLAAIHLVETAMGRVDGVSSAGALGPMQFMPGTWDAFGEGDVFDPADAIMAAARYLAHNGAPQDMDTALFNYNRHRNYVRAVRHYASVMADDPRTYRAFHQFQVYVQTVAGDVLLPVGYDEAEPVLAADYLARPR